MSAEYEDPRAGSSESMLVKATETTASIGGWGRSSSGCTEQEPMTAMAIKAALLNHRNRAADTAIRGLSCVSESGRQLRDAAGALQGVVRRSCKP